MSSNTGKIVSMSCQGHAEPHKIYEKIIIYEKKSYSISLLQDTHFNPKWEKCISGWKCETELTLLAFWKKIQNTEEIKRTLFN